MITFVSRLYRMAFCRGGHGVHSPFAFDLITKVIEEKRQYYCYERLSSARRQIQQNIDKPCFSEGENRFLFRLANYFKPKTIFITGRNLGLTPLYVTAYSKETVCTAFETEPTAMPITRYYADKYARGSVHIHDCAPGKPNNIDLIIWGSARDISLSTFEEYLAHTRNDSVMVISGIRASSKNKRVWRSICAHSKVSVTVDLYNLGLVFFNSKLHRRTYKCIIL